jgi:drug/metabolite transporter (DMT)-like permease
VHAAYHLFLNSAYRFGDLNHVYPLAQGSAPLLVTALAATAAGEVPSVLGAAAILMMSLGVASLSFDRGSGTDMRRRPIILALATGALIAVYTVIDGLGIRAAASPWTYIVWLMFLEGIPFMAWTALRRRREVGPYLRREWKQALAVGILSKLAYGFVLYALAQGAMAHVSALRETSVLFAALIGTSLLKETFGIRRAAADVIASGVVLLQVS